MRTLENSDVPDEMPHYLPRQKQTSEIYIFYSEIIVCDPLIYRMDHPKFIAGLFPAILGKGPWSKFGNFNFNLTSKLGEINDIEHNKGSKIYPQNQVILEFIMPSIPLKHKCLSIILIWVIVSHK